MLRNQGELLNNFCFSYSIAGKKEKNNKAFEAFKIENQNAGAKAAPETSGVYELICPIFVYKLCLTSWSGKSF